MIKNGHVGLLYEDGKLVRALEPGKHTLGKRYFDKTVREVVQLDVRERSTTIKNQEILTADKVTVRLSLLVYFKVVDAISAVTRLTNFEDRIYEDVQLSARRFLATRTLDQMLIDRNELSDAIKADVAASLLGYGVEILRADVKDLIFPGNLKDVMNKVIETARQAEAQRIATQSRVETLRLEAQSRAEALQLEARAQALAQDEKLKSDAQVLVMLEKHPLMVKLKELETLERIGSKGNNHFFVGVDPREHLNGKQ
jgi:regulator of protease activity HflC (stomatin/prohibitin superfamily)